MKSGGIFTEDMIKTLDALKIDLINLMAEGNKGLALYLYLIVLIDRGVLTEVLSRGHAGKEKRKRRVAKPVSPLDKNGFAKVEEIEAILMGKGVAKWKSSRSWL